MHKLFNTAGGDLRWGWKALIVIFGTILFGVILSSVLMAGLTVAYSSQGLAPGQAMEKATIDLGSFGSQVVLSVLQLGFMVWLVRLLIGNVEKQSFAWSKLGLTQIPDRAKQLSIGVLLAMLLSLSTIGIGLTTGTLEYLGSGFELFTPVQVFTTLLLAILLALASGFGEEIVFRGYLQSLIAKRYNASAAILIVAVLFALSHPVVEVQNPWLYLAMAILVGVLFGVTFVRSGSLWMGIALHTVWNYSQIAVVAIRGGADERFFGAPLFVFGRISGSSQMLVESAVILVGSLVVFWLTKPAMKKDTRLYGLK